MPESNFMGQNGFQWFIGVCEDRDDPLKMGRIRVRCLGIHTDDLSLLPTDSLPWAYVMAPTTTSSMQGLGETPHFIVQGSQVIGFFKDGEDKQQPIIMGTLPGYNTEDPDISKGFSDPDGVYPSVLGIDDVNSLGRGSLAESHPSVQLRRNLRQTSIPIAGKPHLEQVSQTLTEPEARTSYDERDAKSNAPTLYPFNHVHETESGHVHEIDDTVGGERIHKQHRIGTFEEWHPDGARVLHTVHDNYEIIAGDSNIFIHKRENDAGESEAGNLTITVEGDCKQLIKGDYVLEVEGNYTQKIHKNSQIRVGAQKEGGGNLEEEIRGNHSLNIYNAYYGAVGTATEGPKDYQQTIGGSESRDIVGSVDIYTDANYTLFSMIDAKITSSVNMTLTTVSGIMSFKTGDKLNMKSGKAMHIKTEADGLTIDSVGLVTENFSAAQDTNVTGKIDINATDDITIDSGEANIELNP